MKTTWVSTFGFILLMSTVVASAAPTPTPTPTSSSCDALVCILSGGTCVNNACVKASPTPTQTPRPTPTLTPIPTSFSLAAVPWSNVTVHKISCQNLDITNLVPVLTTSTLPSGNVYFYSGLIIPDATVTTYLAQKDILGNTPFILYSSGDPIKGCNVGAFPAGGWSDTDFKKLIARIPGGVTCESLVSAGVYFVLGYAPQGDLTQLNGAAFAFVTTIP
jgi:hypothetical protein